MSKVGSVVVIRRSGKDGATLDWDSSKPGLLLGRHEDCDIRVQLPTVSRRHATLSVDSLTGVVTIADHSPVNPTQINSFPMTKGQVVVNHGDTITVGDRQFRFEYASGSTPLAASEAEAEAEAEDKENTNIKTLYSSNLKGDPTQELSKFVRVAAPKSKNKLGSTKKSRKSTLPSVEEAPEQPMSSKKKSGKKRDRSPPTPQAATASTSNVRLTTPLKNNIKAFDPKNLKSRTVGSVIAVADSFKSMVPVSLPAHLKNEINVRRKSLSGNLPIGKRVLNTPLKKNIKARGSQPKMPVKTPVKRAIDMLRKKADVKKATPQKQKQKQKSPYDNSAAFAAAQFPIPSTPHPPTTSSSSPSSSPLLSQSPSPIKSTFLAFPTLSTPVKRSINARRQSYASSRKKMPSSKKMSKTMKAAIQNYAANNHSNKPKTPKPTNKKIEFLADRLQVEAFASEVVEVTGVDNKQAVQCALDSYMSNVVSSAIGNVAGNFNNNTNTNTNNTPASPTLICYPDDMDDVLVTSPRVTTTHFSSATKASSKKSARKFAKTPRTNHKNSLRTLPTPIRSTIVSMRRDYDSEEEGKDLVAVDDEGDEEADEIANLEALFQQRPEDVNLVEDYADAFVTEGGVQKKQAYGYALDAYLEGLGEFWASVQDVDEEEEFDADSDADEEEEIDDDDSETETETKTETKKAASIPLPKSAIKASPAEPKPTRRFSIPTNMGASLFALFSRKEKTVKVKNRRQSIEQSNLDEDIGDSLFSLFSTGDNEEELQPVTEEEAEEEQQFESDVEDLVEEIKASETTVNSSLALGMAVDAMLEEADEEAEEEAAAVLEEEEEEEEEEVAAPSPKKARVDTPPPTPVDFTKLKVAELRAECAKRNLDEKGLKAVLVKRLQTSSSFSSGTSMDVDSDTDGDGDSDTPEIDFKSMKVTELRKECAKRNLDEKGLKAVLIKRLESSSSSSSSGDEEKEEEEEEEEEHPAVDFSKMKVVELRAELEKRGLDPKGLKAVLVKRLKSA